MKYNLKNRPHIINAKGEKIPSYLDVWFEGFEKELKKSQKECEDALKTAKSPVRIGWNWQLVLLKEILGDLE